MNHVTRLPSLARRLGGAAVALALLVPTKAGAEIGPAHRPETIAPSRLTQETVPVGEASNPAETVAVEAPPASAFKNLLRESIAGGRSAPSSNPPSEENSSEPPFAAALSDQSVAYLGESAVTASSSLDPERALRLAKLVCAVTPHASYCYILPTGSMKPLFGEKVILLLETAPFASLQAGDIVTYLNPRLNTLVVHRLMTKDREKFRSKGDANRRQDDGYVTSSNYRQRVFAIIYTKSQPD